MAKVFPVYTGISSLLKTALTAAGAGFVDGYVPEGEAAPKNSNGSMKPFATLILGDADTHRRGVDICGLDTALEELDFLVIVSAETNYHMIGLIDVVRSALIGKKPSTGSGPIAPGRGTIAMPVGSLLHPMRFNKGIGFRVSIGANVGE